MVSWQVPAKHIASGYGSIGNMSAGLLGWQLLKGTDMFICLVFRKKPTAIFGLTLIMYLFIAVFKYIQVFQVYTKPDFLPVIRCGQI